MRFVWVALAALIISSILAGEDITFSEDVVGRRGGAAVAPAAQVQPKGGASVLKVACAKAMVVSEAQCDAKLSGCPEGFTVLSKTTHEVTGCGIGSGEKIFVAEAQCVCTLAGRRNKDPASPPKACCTAKGGKNLGAYMTQIGVSYCGAQTANATKFSKALYDAHNELKLANMKDYFCTAGLKTKKAGKGNGRLSLGSGIHSGQGKKAKGKTQKLGWHDDAAHKICKGHHCEGGESLKPWTCKDNYEPYEGEKHYKDPKPADRKPCKYGLTHKWDERDVKKKGKSPCVAFSRARLEAVKKGTLKRGNEVDWTNIPANLTKWKTPEGHVSAWNSETQTRFMQLLEEGLNDYKWEGNENSRSLPTVGTIGGNNEAFLMDKDHNHMFTEGVPAKTIKDGNPSGSVRSMYGAGYGQKQNNHKVPAEQWMKDISWKTSTTRVCGTKKWRKSTCGKSRSKAWNTKFKHVCDRPLNCCPMQCGPNIWFSKGYLASGVRSGGYPVMVDNDAVNPPWPKWDPVTNGGCDAEKLKNITSCQKLPESKSCWNQKADAANGKCPQLSARGKPTMGRPSGRPDQTTPLPFCPPPCSLPKDAHILRIAPCGLEYEGVLCLMVKFTKGKPPTASCPKPGAPPPPPLVNTWVKGIKAVGNTVPIFKNCKKKKCKNDRERKKYEYAKWKQSIEKNMEKIARKAFNALRFQVAEVAQTKPRLYQTSLTKPDTKLGLIDGLASNGNAGTSIGVVKSSALKKLNKDMKKLASMTAMPTSEKERRLANTLGEDDAIGSRRRRWRSRRRRSKKKSKRRRRRSKKKSPKKKAKKKKAKKKKKKSKKKQKSKKKKAKKKKANKKKAKKKKKDAKSPKKNQAKCHGPIV